jgi:hypothetical protein
MRSYCISGVPGILCRSFNLQTWGGAGQLVVGEIFAVGLMVLLRLAGLHLWVCSR